MNDQHNDPLTQLPNLTRQGFVMASGATALGLALAACSKSGPSATAGVSPSPSNSPSPSASAASASPNSGAAASKNAFGLQLRSGAAPTVDQFYVTPFDSTGASYKALDFSETVYSRAPLADHSTSRWSGSTRTTASSRARPRAGTSLRTRPPGPPIFDRASCGVTARN